MRKPQDPFAGALALHRAELLRHCYRMLGSFHDADDVVQEVLASAWKAREQYTGAAPIRHWLFRIATNACLNARRAGRRRSFPDRSEPSSAGDAPIGDPLDPGSWITPAPDSALFGAAAAPLDAARVAENRETVALAFIALLQGLPPRQRAALLLKDVVGFSTDEIAGTLKMSPGAVSSSLHRAREVMPMRASPGEPAPEPEVLREYIRCWEMRDIDGLLALLHHDVTLSMPPWTMWVQGRADVRRFLTTDHVDAFWSSGLRLVATRANGQQALIFHRDGGKTEQALQILRFDGEAIIEMQSFIGAAFLHGF
jgi:RNA polymerase sigma-70 factor, ECF subfamily